MKRRTFIEQTTLFGTSLVGTQLISNLIAPAQAAPIKELNFGIISTESQANQRPLWEPFIADLSKSIGIPVRAFYATQYAGVIEAMRFGKVQVAWYGGKSYIEAARIANAEVFAQVVNSDGTKGYYSYLIANKQNPITAAAKQQGGDKYVIKNASKLTFAFNDPNSTSGFLVPSYYVFAKNKIDPKKAFKRLIFAGSHEATALAIANQQVDIATNNSEALERLEATNPTARQKIEIIWTSPVIPSDPIAYRKDLPEDVKKKLRNFFHSYKDTRILAPFKWAGFVPAQDKTWNAIRELDIAKKILELENKPNLSNTDRQKLNDLNNQLRAI
ncbi:phosphonate ABC transporter substrate-binding protein [Nodularia harveyana UHCC-0300]|uniref:Phosphonate ABC transporter substrate-binding protein n=1 Tax=Nodularia harveyana UHCC-0300 TaxID=2974287 RepID=A0ABU5UE88_9CYAN|nr:phosphonate ABC transporter substrate-binding protein [Nodularia harveyana]MEA5581484.1 phosphonate ABC transporter substrate-binding protein [Nodularia harveyana UHCC-0300]